MDKITVVEIDDFLERIRTRRIAVGSLAMVPELRALTEDSEESGVPVESMMVAFFAAFLTACDRANEDPDVAAAAMLREADNDDE